jgi:signal transduction histidine kinase
MEPVELAHHVESVLAGHREEPGKVITSSLHPGIVDADPIRVRQILRNLITNAIRYGGPNVHVAMTSTTGAHVVEVIDDGPGIPAEDHERIFEAYERAHATAGTPGSVGLGLTVSRTLAQLMGGSLTYHFDGRSRFRLELSRDVDAERELLRSEPEVAIDRVASPAIGVGRIGVDVGVVD